MTYGNAEIGSATFKIAYDGSELEEGLRIADSQMRSFGRTVGAFGAGVLGAAGFAVKLAVDAEAAFIGVQKTVEGTTEQYEVLNKELKELAVHYGVSFAEAAKFAEIAGTLGIEIENIKNATETALMLQVSVPGGDPVTMFRQLARFTQLIDGGIENLGKYSSILVGLGNNFNTTEPEIINLAVRLAPLAKSMGLSAEETLAFSTQMKVAGLNSELAASAFLRLHQLFTGVMTETPDFLTAVMKATKQTREEIEGIFNSVDDDGIKKLAAQLNMDLEDVQSGLQESFGDPKSRFEQEFGSDGLKDHFRIEIFGDPTKMSILEKLLNKDSHEIEAMFMSDYGAFLTSFITELATGSEADPTYITSILDALGFKSIRLEQMIKAMSANLVDAANIHDFSEEESTLWEKRQIAIALMMGATVAEAKAMGIDLDGALDDVLDDSVDFAWWLGKYMEDAHENVEEEGEYFPQVIQDVIKDFKPEMQNLEDLFWDQQNQLPAIVGETNKQLESDKTGFNRLIEIVSQTGVAWGTAILPFLQPILEEDGPVMKGLQGLENWAESNPGLATAIGGVVLALGAIATIGGVIAIAAPGFVVFAKALVFLSKGIGFLLGVTGTVGAIASTVAAVVLIMYIFRDNIFGIINAISNKVDEFFAVTIPNFFEGFVQWAEDKPVIRELFKIGKGIGEALVDPTSILSGGLLLPKNIVDEVVENFSEEPRSEMKKEFAKEERTTLFEGRRDARQEVLDIWKEEGDPLDMANLMGFISGERGFFEGTLGLPERDEEEIAETEARRQQLLQDAFLEDETSFLDSTLSDADIERINKGVKTVENIINNITVNVEGSVLAEQDLEDAIELAIESSRQAGYDDEPVSSEGNRGRFVPDPITGTPIPR